MFWRIDLRSIAYRNAWRTRLSAKSLFFSGLSTMSRFTPDGPGRTVPVVIVPAPLDLVGGDVGVVDLAGLEGDQRGRGVLELASDDLVEVRLARASSCRCAASSIDWPALYAVTMNGPVPIAWPGGPEVGVLLHRLRRDALERRLLDDEQVHDVEREERVRLVRLDRDGQRDREPGRRSARSSCRP